MNCLRQAVALQHDLAEAHGEALSLDHLGQVLLAVGRGAEAQASWRRALGIFTELEHPQAAAVAARLDARSLPSRPGLAAITALRVPVGPLSRPAPVSDGSSG